MIEYRREIDGLRAVAVLGVFFYHLGWVTFRGGWLGVDVFFVISGYLICSLLFAEGEESGTVSLSGFYLRRARRILPALVVCLIGSYPMALLVKKTYIFTEYCQSFLAALFSVSNIFFWQKTGYFELSAALSPLLHTWTLGVEEQFYLIIPTFFLLMTQKNGKYRPHILFVLFGSMVLSFLLCRYGGHALSYPFRFYMLPTRMWELLLGLFVALLLRTFPAIRKRSIVTEIASFIGLALICYAFWRHRGSGQFVEKTLFASLATALLLATSSEHHFVGRLLSFRPVRFVGNISYSIYLWHWPFLFLWHIAVLKYGLKDSPVSVAGLIVTVFIVSSLSWAFVEKPFRRIKSWSKCLRLLGPMVLVAVFLGVYGFLYLGADKGEFAVSEEGRAHFTKWKDVQRESYFHIGPEGAPRFVLVGDSHAWAASPVIIRLADEFGIPGEATIMDGTMPFENISYPGRPPFAKQWVEYALKHKIPNVILISKWDNYKTVSQSRYTGTQKEWNVDTAMYELRQTIEKLIRNGSQVWVLDTVPYFSKNPILMTRILGDTPYSEEVRASDFIRKMIEPIRSPRLHRLDPWPALVSDGRLVSVRDGAFLYTDSNHLSHDGSLALKGVFQPVFKSME